jgi:hypothetical protein
VLTIYSTRNICYIERATFTTDVRREFLSEISRYLNKSDISREDTFYDAEATSILDLADSTIISKSPTISKSELAIYPTRNVLY